jgi:hypothetical protein
MKNKSYKLTYIFIILIFSLISSCEQKVDNIISTREYTITEANRIISWQLPGITNIKYHLQISENFTFTKLIIEEHELKVPEYRVPIEKLIPYQKYFWRVMPEAQGGIWSQPKELIFVIPTPDTI